jgi:hypothetical protein
MGLQSQGDDFARCRQRRRVERMRLPRGPRSCGPGNAAPAPGRAQPAFNRPQHCRSVHCGCGVRTPFRTCAFRERGSGTTVFSAYDYPAAEAKPRCEQEEVLRLGPIKMSALYAVCGLSEKRPSPRLRSLLKWYTLLAQCSPALRDVLWGPRGSLWPRWQSFSRPQPSQGGEGSRGDVAYLPPRGLGPAMGLQSQGDDFARCRQRRRVERGHLPRGGPSRGLRNATPAPGQPAPTQGAAAHGQGRHCGLGARTQFRT